MNRNFIWDLDGTLIDSYKVIVDGLYNTYLEVGIKLDKKEIHSYILKYSCDDYIKQLEKKFNIPFNVIKSRYSESSHDNDSEITLIKHAKEILEFLVNNKDTNYIYTHRGKSAHFILKNLGIEGYFKEIVTSENGFARKPNPEGINYLINKYNLDKSSIYYIGDRKLDIDVAKNSQVKSILYFPEGSFALNNIGEDYIINDLLDIKNM